MEPALVTEIATNIDGKPPGHVDIATYPNPKYFDDFEEVIFLTAMFRETLLYHFWTQVFGIKFEDHPHWKQCPLRDTHAEQAEYMEIGYVLNEHDRASSANMQKPDDSPASNLGQMVSNRRTIEHAIHVAADYFDDKFLLSINRWSGYLDGGDENLKEAVPLIGDVVSSYTHGMNSYSQYNNVAVFATTNPSTTQANWVARRLGMPVENVFRAYRIHSIYQTVGRISIREAGNTEQKKILVLSKEDAEFLANEIFVGAKLIHNQVGDISRLSKVAGRPRRRSDDDQRKIGRLKSRLTRARKRGDQDSADELEAQIRTLRSAAK
jgi:hypothetical protein